MEHKTLTWAQVLKSPHNEVIVESYGYMEKGFFSSHFDHFEPFKRKRQFVFTIDRCKNPLSLSSLNHKRLFLEDREDSLQFIEKDGKLYLDDPDLWARP
jgi:hypothetical protein